MPVDKCAKNVLTDTSIVQLIINNVVTCFFDTHCRYRRVHNVEKGSRDPNPALFGANFLRVRIWQIINLVCCIIAGVGPTVFNVNPSNIRLKQSEHQQIVRANRQSNAYGGGARNSLKVEGHRRP